jgi:hypothetical protein
LIRLWGFSNVVTNFRERNAHDITDKLLAERVLPAILKSGS